jgi:hypothetical protein
MSTTFWNLRNTKYQNENDRKAKPQSGASSILKRIMLYNTRFKCSATISLKDAKVLATFAVNSAVVGLQYYFVIM